MPPWIWPSRASGFMIRPTSWVVATSTARTRPSSPSTSHTARWAAKPSATTESPWPVSGSSGDRRAVAVDGGLLDRAVGERPLGQPLADARAGQLDRAAGHPGLPRRRRRPRRADRRVGGEDHHLLDVELGAGDLLEHRHQALADLGGGGVDLRDPALLGDQEAHAGRRVVVEPLGEGDVLEADREADAPPGALAVGGVGDAARQLAQVDRRAAGQGRQRHGAQLLEQLAHGRGPVDDLPGGQAHAGLQGVAQAQVHRIDLQGRGEPVHLRLVREGDLHRSEAAHRPAGRVVGVGDDRVDVRVRHVVGAAGEGGRVGHHGRAARRVGAAVQHDAGAHVDQPAVAGRRRARSASTRGGGGRARRTTPPASRPSSPAARCASRASPRGPASRGPPARRRRRRRRTGAGGSARAAGRGSRPPGPGRRAATGSAM